VLTILSGEVEMRGVLAVLVIVYLVGVGFELAPIFSSASNSSVSVLFANVTRELPDALEWPVRVYHRFKDQP
jgi:hypothetical protein